MATFFPNTSTGSTVAFNFAANGDSVFVLSSRVLANSSGAGIRGTQSSLKVSIQGTVFGHSSAVALGDNAAVDFGNRVVIVEGGYAGSSTSAAIHIKANGGAVDNAGTIEGHTGVKLENGVYGNMYIDNAGRISASYHAVEIGAATQGYVFFRNFGEVSSSLTNSGGKVFNSATSLSHDKITNRGTMQGNIEFGAGEDLYDGRNGTLVGTINGGIGNDTIFVSADEETMDGGGDMDTLDFRSSSAVSFALLGTLDVTGFAVGDTFSNFENIYGSAFADTLRGSNAANILLGRGGIDKLEGLSGSDEMNGGLGKDVQTGGGGDDRFRFLSLVESGDTITDFTNVNGNNDLFEISKAGFGGGLVATNGLPIAASMFRNRADNLAQDANDRFIFRTTDKTLWFDSNGNGNGGLTMIADLQQSATVTAADIYIF